jgi:hypothetical protein
MLRSSASAEVFRYIHCRFSGRLHGKHSSGYASIGMTKGRATLRAACKAVPFVQSCAAGPYRTRMLGLGRSPPLAQRLLRSAHASRCCIRTYCKRGGDDTTTSVLRRRVTDSNISAKWCGVACIAQLHSVKRTQEPNQTVGASIHLRGRGTQKEKGRVCKALFGGSIPSRASTSLYWSRLYRPYFSHSSGRRMPGPAPLVVFARRVLRFDTTIFLRMKTVACGLSLYRPHRS